MYAYSRYRLPNRSHLQARSKQILSGTRRRVFRGEADNAVREKEDRAIECVHRAVLRRPRSSRVMSRKKEVKRIGPQSWPGPNIRRPYMRHEAPFGAFKDLSKSYNGRRVIQRFSATVTREEKVV